MGEYVSKRIPLAGGREVEIIYYHEPTPAAAPCPPPPREPATDLHLCRNCDCDMVQPATWTALDDDRWRIGWRCPNCLQTGLDTVSQEEAEMFDDILSDGTEQALCTLREVERRRMSEDVERLVAAIWDDRLQPFDF